MPPTKLIVTIEKYSFPLTEYFVVANGSISPRRRTGLFMNSIEALTIPNGQLMCEEPSFIIL